MSSINQTATQPQQPARGRPGNTPPQHTQAAGQRKLNTLEHHSQAVMHHHVEGLVFTYLDANPSLLVGILLKQEQFLAQYVRNYYGVLLPTRKGLQCPKPATQIAQANVANAANVANPANVANVAVAKPQFKQPPLPAKLSGPHATNPHRSSTEVPKTTNYQRSTAESSQVKNYQRPSVESAQATSYQRPTVDSSQVQNYHRPCAESSQLHSYQQPTVESSQVHTYQHSAPELSQVADHQAANVENGDSPKSTTSQPCSNWPTQEDLDVPYPASTKTLKKEEGLPRGKGNKWTFHEQDLAIEAMFLLQKDATFPKTEKRFEEISHVLMEKHGIERSKDSVKNMWNRIGRHRSNCDERKNKSAQMSTSQQGRQARAELEAKRNEKRKADARSEQPVKKKAKRSSMGNKPSVGNHVDLTSSTGDDFNASSLRNNVDLTSTDNDMTFASSFASDPALDPSAWGSMTSQEMAASNAWLDADLDALFGGTDVQAPPHFIDPRDVHLSYPAQAGVSKNQGISSTTASSAYSELPPIDTFNQVQPSAPGTQDMAPAPVFPALPPQVEPDPSPESQYTNDDDLARTLLAELEDENGMYEFGQNDLFNNNAYAY